MTGRRIVSISLPHFAMERWQRWKAQQGNAIPDDMPVVLSCEGPHGPVIHATNRAARQNGVSEGARVTDMRAICPDLQVEYGDPEGDKAALKRLMLWARRWCPWGAVDGTGLILDTTGSDHLYGGEAAMLRDIEAGLARLDLSARLAIAPTWGAAWALARFGPVRATCGDEGISEALAALPVAGLRLDTDTLLLLHRLGLKTISQLAEVPRLSLTRRFAKAALPSNPLLRLDQAMGRLAEPVSSTKARSVFRTQSRLPEPIFDPTPYLPELVEALCGRLSEAGCGCRKLDLTIYRSDGEISQLGVATSAPSRDAAHLIRLFDDRLERLNPGFGFDLITLQAGAVEQMDQVQHRLDGGTEEDLELSRLIDRLTAKLGDRAVSRPAMYDSHVPERAEARVGALAGSAADMDVVAAGHNRPIRLFDMPQEVRVLYAVPEGPPAQFIWRRQTHRVTRYEGPERIAPEWWRDRPGTRLRDYFRIEDQDGRRFWLYREGLHEDGRGGDPRWFVHGVFA